MSVVSGAAECLSHLFHGYLAVLLIPLPISDTLPSVAPLWEAVTLLSVHEFLSSCICPWFSNLSVHQNHLEKIN